MKENLLTVAETAERLRLKLPTIRRMIMERRITVIRPGARAVRIPESAIQDILRRGLQPSIASIKVGPSDKDFCKDCIDQMKPHSKLTLRAPAKERMGN